MALSLENCSSFPCSLLDFSKAFDLVPNKRLLFKLEAIGIRGSPIAGYVFLEVY